MKKTDVLNRVKRLINLERPEEFVSGKTYIRTSGASWDADDVASVVEVALGRWYTDAGFAHEFERSLAFVVKQRYVSLCNSGSSANLLAISALMSKRLRGRRLKAGDEVITVAAGFPTTVNPIIQNGMIPVFVDSSLPTYNALPNAIAEAITEKTRAIFIAHTLGNPFKAKEIKEIAEQNNLWLIADCCDALGATHHNQPVSTFADISTFSFYPAHHISMGEGGAVATDNAMLDKIIRSFRDWGRDCWCDTGKDNTCGKRFGWHLGSLPDGFDHKYTYSEIGYNLKATDFQAALGVSQLKKLSQFVETRKMNWRFYREQFDELRKYFILPEATIYSEPSWFGFTMTVREDAPFTREKLVRYLEDNKIGTRMLFAGNLTKHPAYEGVRYRISNVLAKTDVIMNGTFWIGVAPVITRPMQCYVVEKMKQFVQENR